MKFSLISLLMFCSLLLQGQVNLKPAYVVTNDGDTISGYIDFRTNKINATQCLFKSTLESEPIIYKPGSIQSYRFVNEGKKYLSFTITINGEERLVFLEFLLKGIMSLYYYQDESTDQEYYFFENEEKEITPITQGENYVNDKNQLVEDVKYLGRLSFLFKDTPKVLNSHRIRFHKTDMIKLVEKYHNEVCTTGEECIEFENRYNDRALKVKLSIFGGVNFYKYKIGYSKTTSATNTSPTIGLQLNLINPRWNPDISLQIEGALSQVQLTRSAFNKGGHYYQGELKNATYYAASRYKALVWNTSISPKFTYPKGIVRPTIEVGLNTSVLFAKKSKLKPSGEYVTKLDDENEGLRSFFIGLHAAVGVDYKLRESNFVIFRIGYDMSFSKSAIIDADADKLSGFSVKTGYTF